jgi:sporulation protein YlmC with PRC-barrel domain
MRFSEAKNRKVMSTNGAVAVGKLRALIVDPRTAHITALSLKKTEGNADTLPWNNLTSFGRDAITIESLDRITVADGELAVLSDKHHAVIGKRVLTETGDDIGKVKDIEFDPDDGAIRAVITNSEEVAGARMLGLGSFALVVRV